VAANWCRCGASRNRRFSPVSASPLPLSGLRVIAVEQYGAGPYGSMQLADLGAEIVKIEDPVEDRGVTRGL